MIVWCLLGIVGVSFYLSATATPLAKRIAAKTGMMDVPGAHKGHKAPTPLLGGSAIFAAILLPAMLGLAMANIWNATGAPSWLGDVETHLSGIVARTPQAMAILGGAMLLHVLGLIDDKKNLGPWKKLFVQLVVSAIAAIGGEVRVLTVLGPAMSVAATIIWLTVLMNSFNFLDNMDGLSAGVAAICAAALLGAAVSMGQWFVAAWLCLILGSLLGFLPYNFHPASIYMGDAGSLVIGYLLGVASCLTTYIAPGQAQSWYPVLVPVVLMAVPLYDTASVMFLRLRAGKNPMIGDRQHFSHRLVNRGMSVRVAVMTIYFCTFATAIAAWVLPHVATATGTALVVAQTLAILCVIAMMEGGRKSQ